MSWWKRCWRTGGGGRGRSARARGGGRGQGGEADKTRALWFFSRHLVAVMARPSLRPWRVSPAYASSSSPPSPPAQNCSMFSCLSSANSSSRGVEDLSDTFARSSIWPRAPLSGHVAMLRTRPTRRMWRNPPSEASEPDLSSLEASRLPPATRRRAPPPRRRAAASAPCWRRAPPPRSSDAFVTIDGYSCRGDRRREPQRGAGHDQVRHVRVVPKLPARRRR